MLKSTSIELTIAKPNSIDCALTGFIQDVANFSNKDMLDMHIYVLNVLREHLNRHGNDSLIGHELLDLAQQQRQQQSFCTVYSAIQIIPNLEKFLRFCLYREENTSEYMRHCFTTVFIRFFHWLFQNEIISDNDYRQFSNIITKLALLEEQAEKAKNELSKSLMAIAKGKIQLFEVTQTLGENLWLKSANNEPITKPLKLNRVVVDLIEIGWTIECSIENLVNRPTITSCQNIYPSLPSNY